MKNKFKIIITLIILLLVIMVMILFSKKQNVNKIYPSVVHLECKNDNTFTVGSGIVYELKDNILYIVTNYHIIKGYSKINVYDEEFNKEVAKLINYDEEKDIAVLAIRNNLNVKKATFDLSNKIKEKDEVYVLTSFRGKDATYIVKDAIVSKVTETINLNNKAFNTIKLSYSIENGDSGSPVINKKGKVIGMIFLKDKDILHYGYAIPIQNVIKETKKLINSDFDKINLGAFMTNSTNISLLKEYNIDINVQKGVVLLSVKEKYPLYNSGLRKGDVIVEFDNVSVNNMNDLNKIIKKHKKNDNVSIKYYRKKELVETNLKLTK